MLLISIIVSCGLTEKRLVLLGAFAKLRKASFSFVLSVCLSLFFCPSVCPHGTTLLQVDGFCIFPKSVEKIQVTLKPSKLNFLSRPIIYIFDLARLLSEWKVFQSCRANEPVGSRTTMMRINSFHLLLYMAIARRLVTTVKGRKLTGLSFWVRESGNVALCRVVLEFVFTSRLGRAASRSPLELRRFSGYLLVLNLVFVWGFGI